MSINGQGARVILSSNQLEGPESDERLYESVFGSGSLTNNETEDAVNDNLISPDDNVLPYHSQSVNVDGSSSIEMASLKEVDFPPTISNASSYQGGIYSQSQLDVSPNQWYFPNDSSWGAFLDFNTAFLTNTGSRPVSSFKFEQFSLTGNPSVNVLDGGPSDLAFATTTPNYDLSLTNATLSNIDSLSLLASAGSDGGLTVSNLTLTEAGADLGVFSLNGNVGLSSISLASDGSGPSARLSARAAPSFGGITLGGVSANSIDLWSDGSVNVNGDLTAYVPDSETSQTNAVNMISSLTYPSDMGVLLQSSTLINAVANSSNVGGTIRMITQGAEIDVRGTLEADHGTITLQNNGGGLIDLNGVTVGMASNVDNIKAELFGSAGSLSITGGATLNASDMIELYASRSGSNGLVEFSGNASITGSALKKITGGTVRITSGNTVTIDGNDLTVTADSAEFSISNFGTVDDNNGLTADGTGGTFQGNDGNETIILKPLSN
ncbi:MAG: hypothetical protein ABEK50_06855 [bacterium]